MRADAARAEVHHFAETLFELGEVAFFRAVAIGVDRQRLGNADGVGELDHAAVGKAGRKLSFNTKVQFNGNLMVGKAYTAMLDLKPGDEFEIKLGRKQIRLVPLGSEDDEG